MNSKQQWLEMRQALTKVRGEVERKHKSLGAQNKQMSAMANKQEIEPWMTDARNLFRQKDYHYFKLLHLLRKNKLL
ncbi:hypothetical protein [Marinicrinis sediminis]|uniref:Uncharacterized protein n=1 Tax=Marinicrinis sediminis TaxID=1652465 RepID=A0ABW5RAJ5_9BACL